MRRFISSLVILASSVMAAFGQPQTISWILNNPSPQYLMSADDTRLAFFDRTADDKVWAKVLDLNSWEWGISPLLSNVNLTADNKSGYQLWYSMEGSKPQPGWVGYKKYVTNVYTNLPSSAMKRTQWPDQHFVIASMPDGTLLAADKVSFYLEKSSQNWKMKLRGLKVVTIPEGTVVRSLRPDLELDRYFTEIPKQRTVTPNGKWLIWPSYGDWIDAIPLEGGETRRIAVPYAGIQGYAGQYLVSVGRRNTFEGYRDNQKTLIDLATGKAVYDVTVATKTPFTLFAATSSDGSIYTFDEVTRELLEETWKDGAFVRMSGRTLEGEDLALTSESWGKKLSLFVSKPADKVLLLPNSYADGKAQNEAYVWQLSTGKLLYRSPNYIRPHQTYLAKLNAPPIPIAPKVVIGPNMLVQAGGRLYHLRELTSSGQWIAIALVKDRHGYFERQDATKPQQFFSPVTTRVVSTTACPACAGGGSQRFNETRTTETESKMIYNKLVTRKTETVQVNHSCEVCKGSGFQF